MKKEEHKLYVIGFMLNGKFCRYSNRKYKEETAQRKLDALRSLGVEWIMEEVPNELGRK